MLLIAFYNALWLTNYSSTTIPIAYKLYCVLPGILSIFNYIYIVKAAALLKGIIKIDQDAMEEVIEQTEGSRQLGETIRDRVLSRLETMGEPQAELFNLFQQIDSSGNNVLTRTQFAMFMNSMDIHFSRKKWQQIFREIDRNADNQISFEEFFLFLFPEHDIGVALEKRRLKMIGARVRQKVKTHKQKTSLKKKVEAPFRRSVRKTVGDFSMIPK